VYFFRIAGLSIASDIDLPGFARRERSDATAGPLRAEASIVRGPVPTSLEDPREYGPTWQMGPDALLLTVPGIARFHLTGGNTIAVASEPGADAADIPAFLVGSALPILLQLRGLLTLRASAVAVNGKAVLFCGASGQGKSTLAAALAQRGYPLLADDFCTITQSSDASGSVDGDGAALKLWALAIRALQLGDRRGAALRETIQKYHVAPAAQASGPLPLGAIYVLREARAPHEPGIERPNVVDAALSLRRGAYHPRLIEPLGQRPLYFRAAMLGNHAGTYTLTVEHGFHHLPATIDTLERHWRTTAGMERAA
jgi:hypothetical protein